MLTLTGFDVVRPRTVALAVAAKAGAGAAGMYVAGGTDLMPNLKHGLFKPRRLVSLGAIVALREIREEPGGGLRIGAGVSLRAVAGHPVIRARYPSLVTAAGLVASPQIRGMGTIGGNLCLDTRCVYYNQTAFWRQALGHCLKCEGTVCHVVKQGRRCVAAFSADTPAPLITLGAAVELVGPTGTRTVPVRQFFSADGVRNTVREDNEVLTAVVIPPPAPGLHTSYVKLRMREAIDFPALGVAVGARLGAGGAVEGIEVVCGALDAQPRVIRGLEAIAVGKRLTDVAGAVAERAHESCHPLTSLTIDPDWRRAMVPVYVRRALAALIPSRTGADHGRP